MADAHAPLDMDSYIPGLITVLGNKLTSQTSIMYRKAYGVGAIEWRILSLLASMPDATSSDLSRASGLDKAAIARNLGTLRGKGAVAIADDPEHGRRRLVQLTSSGRKLHNRIIVSARKNERRLLSCFSEAESANLTQLLQRLREHLRELST
jgi:DNA-binding MarR family transcriptional regulator